MESSSEFKIQLLAPSEIKKLKCKVTNINLGIMGHIDSGKTTICSSLTSIASTASLDKNPQSKEKGITMDLGFSSFTAQTDKDFEIAGNHFGNLMMIIIFLIFLIVRESIAIYTCRLSWTFSFYQVCDCRCFNH
jgi:hypothetical protein